MSMGYIDLQNLQPVNTLLRLSKLVAKLSTPIRCMHTVKTQRFGEEARKMTPVLHCPQHEVAREVIAQQADVPASEVIGGEHRIVAREQHQRLPAIPLAG